MDFHGAGSFMRSHLYFTHLHLIMICLSPNIAFIDMYTIVICIHLPWPLRIWEGGGALRNKISQFHAVFFLEILAKT